MRRLHEGLPHDEVKGKEWKPEVIAGGVAGAEQRAVSEGAEERRSREAEEPRSRGAEEQRSSGAEGPRNGQLELRGKPCVSPPLRLCPSALAPSDL